MKRSSVLVVMVMMIGALWVTAGSALGAAANTCEGYENKEEVRGKGSGTFPVTVDGSEIGSITYDNNAEPESVTFNVDDGYILEVCVKGGKGLATGSGSSGTVIPPENKGGNSPDISHFAYTVVAVEGTSGGGGGGGGGDEDKTVAEQTDNDNEQDKDNNAKGNNDRSDKAEGDTAAEGDAAEADADVEVAAVGGGAAGGDDAAANQVAQVPSGSAPTGGGSTSGVENAGLFFLGAILLGAAAPVAMFARRANGRA